MSRQWYCRILENEMGPLSFAELRELAQTGTLSPDDRVRPAGAEEWQRADSVVGLFRHAPEAAHTAVEPHADADDPPSFSRTRLPCAEPPTDEPAPRSESSAIPGSRRAWLAAGGAVLLVAAAFGWSA